MTPRDFLRAPGFSDALLLTWSLDPVFFEAVHLPHLRRSGGTGRVLVVADQRQLDAASAQLPRLGRSGRVQGLGRSYTVEGVSAPSHFHPKLWVRFGDSGGRVLVGSSNLTAHGWGGQRELLCSWDIGPDHADPGGWLRPILADLASRVRGPSALELLRRMQDRKWLPVDAPTRSPVLWSGRDSLAQQLEKRWRGRRFDRLVMLTGSTDRKGAMLRWAHDRFGVREAVVIVTPSRASFSVELLAELPLRVRLAEFTPPAVPLHAKLVWFEGADGPAAVVGSANCSASAWLAGDDGPPNVELVAVYDSPDPDAFADLIKDRALAVAPHDLVMSNRDWTAEPSASPGLRITVAEWDSVRRQARVELVPDAGEAMTLVCGEQRVDLVATDNGRVASLEAPRWPALVQVESETGLVSTTRWLADRHQLVHGAQNQRWEGALSSLRDDATPTQHRQMLRDLTRLTNELFDVKTRTSPTGPARSRGAGGPVAPARPLDPAVLEAATASTGGLAAMPHLFRSGLSINGILAAVFDLGGEDPDEGPERPVGASRRGERPDIELPPNVRRSLQRSMARHFNSMDDSAWRRGCSERQLFQALALPLTLALLGLEGGWLRRSDPDAAELVAGVLDLIKPGGGLAPALQRCAARVPERFGDGQMLATFRVAVGLVPWGSRLKRALNMRVLDAIPALSAAVEESHIGPLLGGVRVREEHESLRDRAFVDVQALGKLESWLEENWTELGDQQDEVDWFRVGEVVWLRRLRRWARVSFESPVDRQRTWVEYLSGDAPVRGRTERGSACAIWRGEEAILVNLGALHRLGVEVPSAGLVELGERPVGPLERRGISGTSWR